ncbi:ATPase involved in chromosome partitioning [Thermanaerovibrio velox DSM 12556]|uniref:Iron-sulfur cluster carrier protein n=1 Tax=Thermanaerovibrio velox DSM 12556 TaxID=926567 RepID=H0UMR8_9BACT|nr:P-loop NTPase [Thermanaerovibrio velox]EHM09213.1 ATPase involved in chromosome partitioning [Thermanaerovibrio velox DSM 12556]
MSDSRCEGCNSKGTCDSTTDKCGMPQKGQRKGIGMIVAVGSGKGGVGKSSVSALLAVGLARRGQKVGILDGDITGPSIPAMLGVKGLPTGSPLGIVPPKSPTLGISVMSINLLLEDATKPVVWRGPVISNTIKQFYEEVLWDGLDTLIVDLPPGTADAPLTVMQSLPLDGFVVVTSPQDLVGMVVEKAMHMAQMLNVPILGLVENMAYALCPHCGQRIQLFGPSRIEELSKKWWVPSFASLPIDPVLSNLSDRGLLEEYHNQSVLDDLVEGFLGRKP